MGPDEMYPLVLRELVDVIASPLSIIFHQSQLWGEVPKDQLKVNVMPIFKKDKREHLGKCSVVSLPSIPGKVME